MQSGHRRISVASLSAMVGLAAAAGLASASVKVMPEANAPDYSVTGEPGKSNNRSARGKGMAFIRAARKKRNVKAHRARSRS